MLMLKATGYPCQFSSKELEVHDKGAWLCQAGRDSHAQSLPAFFLWAYCEGFFWSFRDVFRHAIVFGL